MGADKTAPQRSTEPPPSANPQPHPFLEQFLPARQKAMRIGRRAMAPISRQIEGSRATVGAVQEEQNPRGSPVPSPSRRTKLGGWEKMDLRGSPRSSRNSSPSRRKLKGS